MRAGENQENPFYRTRFARLLTKLTLWLQGYGFREAELLGRLTNAAFDGVQDCVISLFQLLVDMEFYLASLSLQKLAKRSGLEMCLPEFKGEAEAAQPSSKRSSIHSCCSKSGRRRARTSPPANARWW